LIYLIDLLFYSISTSFSSSIIISYYLLFITPLTILSASASTSIVSTKISFINASVAYLIAYSADAFCCGLSVTLHLNKISLILSI